MATSNRTERERDEIVRRRARELEADLARDKRDRDNERHRRRAGTWEQLPNRNSGVSPR